jgi:hypothetical protein
MCGQFVARESVQLCLSQSNLFRLLGFHPLELISANRRKSGIRSRERTNGRRFADRSDMT